MRTVPVRRSSAHVTDPVPITALRAAARERYAAAASAVVLPAAGADALAADLLDGLSPDQWTLEWSLPWWLGRAVGLDAERSFVLSLANVVGLGAIRLWDDLADDEVPPPDATVAAALAPALFAEATDLVATVLPPDSPAWADLAATMAAWRVAPAAYGDPPAELAVRGAPLRIGARAALALSGRADLAPRMERCLDHALDALVLYDDWRDWQADLAAGRPNALVEALAGPRGDRTPSVVVTAVRLGLVRGAHRRYVRRIESEALNAASVAMTLGVHPLAAHLRAFRDAVHAEVAAFDEAQRRTVVAAAHLLTRSAT